jgi:hypothetical protein
MLPLELVRFTIGLVENLQGAEGEGFFGGLVVQGGG